jgi:hypothetical protein
MADFRKPKGFKVVKNLGQLVSHRIDKKLFIEYDPRQAPRPWQISIDGYLMFNGNLNAQELTYYLRGLLQGYDFGKGFEL